MVMSGSCRFVPVLTFVVVAAVGASGATPEQRGDSGAARRQAAARAQFDAHRPPLIFRAEWKRQDAPQHPIKQEDLIDQRVELKLYGDGKNIVWTQHADEPTYAFTGL